MSGQELVEQDAEGVDVAGGGDRIVEDLLRAGIGGGHRRVARHRGDGAGGEIGLEQLDDTEVEEPGGAVFRDQDVAGLEIAVDDQVLVRGVDRRADLAEELQTLADRQPMILAVAIDALALDVLHHDVGAP